MDGTYPWKHQGTNSVIGGLILFHTTTTAAATATTTTATTTSQIKLLKKNIANVPNLTETRTNTGQTIVQNAHYREHHITIYHIIEIYP